MNRQTDFQSCLEKARDLALSFPGKALLLWDGREYEQQEHFTRLDKLFLYLITNDGQSVELMRQIGYVRWLDGSGGRKEPYVYFGDEVLYRITGTQDISRKRDIGKVMPYSRLPMDVSASVAGIRKRVEIGEAPSQFSLRRRGDAQVVDQYLNLLVNNTILRLPNVTDTIPGLYLASRPDNEILYLRQSQATETWLRGFPGYDPHKTPASNLLALRQLVSSDAGKQRQAFPFQHVFGRGIISAAQDGFKQWFLVPYPIKHVRPHLCMQFGDRE